MLPKHAAGSLHCLQDRSNNWLRQTTKNSLRREWELMRMCVAFLDHNKRWSMPCRVYHHIRLENRQAGNGSSESAVAQSALAEPGAELTSLPSVSCTVHYPQRESLPHTNTRIPRSTCCFMFHPSQVSRAVCAISFCTCLSWTLQVNRSIRGLESISVKLIIKGKRKRIL